MQNAWTTYGERSRPRLAPRHRRKGSSNAKVKRELGWAPRYGTWREGFQEWAKSAE